MKNDDIIENVLQCGKEGVKQNIMEALDEFCDEYADEMYRAVEEIIRLRDENAALRERVEKAVEFPFENLDKVFILAGEYTEAKQFIPDRLVEGTIVGFGYDIYEWADGNYKFNYDVLVGENNYIFALEQFNKTLFKTREAAEARLAELKGGER